MITEGKNVKFNYVLKVNNQVVDSSEGKEPLGYVHGQKMIGSFTESVGNNRLKWAMESVENQNSRGFPTDPTAYTAVIETELIKIRGLFVNKPFILNGLGLIRSSSHPQILLTRQMIIPGLESKLEGLKAGDKKTVIVGPEDAYGTINDKAIIEVPRDKLGSDIEPQAGMMLQMTGNQGQPIPGKIVEVRDSSIIVDFNHPLAGKELQFEIEIVEVH